RLVADEYAPAGVDRQRTAAVQIDEPLGVRHDLEHEIARRLEVDVAAAQRLELAQDREGAGVDREVAAVDRTREHAGDRYRLRTEVEYAAVVESVVRSDGARVADTDRSGADLGGDVACRRQGEDDERNDAVDRAPQSMTHDGLPPFARRN